MLAFFVNGVPAPQGSKSAYVRGGRAVIVEGASKSGREKHKAWRNTVTLAAIAARDTIESELPLDQPLHLRVDFVMPRPTSAPKSSSWAHKKPDIDKLLRSTLDALTDAGIWTDDSRVASLIATKRLTTDGITGAQIEVSPAHG